MQNHSILPVTFSMLLITFLLLHRVQLQAQSQDNNQLQLAELLTKTRMLYGHDEVLENGKLYSPAHPKAKGNPFFSSPGWKTGKLDICGDVYVDIGVNYDVTLDQVILKKEIANQENHYPIILNSNFINSFEFEGHTFVNLKDTTINKELPGYTELIYRGNFIFLAKHVKEFLNQYSQSNPYGYYSKLYSDYYIVEGEKLTRLNTKRVFLSYFDANRKDLKKYFRQNNIKYKKESNSRLADLLEYADELSHK